MSYHFPMQDLLRRGWNPVYVATVEDFRELNLIGGSTMGMVHTLFLPRLNALCGALIGASTGLFVADAFLNYAMVLVLLFTAYDFSRRFWGVGKALSALFSFSVAFTTKFSAFLTGYVDYLTYAGILTMLFSSVLYLRERRVGDLVVFASAFLVAALAKSTGLVVSALVGICLVPRLWKDKKFWAACCLAGVYVAVVGFSPFITSWMNYGSPLYPMISFSSAHPPIDITSDFTGNPDALKMGYVARSVYAWVSPWLAEKACALVYGKPDFNPVFTVYGGVCGFGTMFRFLLLASVAALLLSRKNAVTAICGFLFVTTLVAPLKYLGYSRYFLQVWAIPPLALFNLAACPIAQLAKCRFARAIRSAALSVPVLVALFCTARTLAFNGRCLALESRRQAAIEKLKSESACWRSDGACENSYMLSRRLNVAGVEYCREAGIGGNASALSYAPQHIWASVENAKEEAESVEAEFFIANSVGDLFRFPWLKAYSSFPKVLWSGFN